MIPYVSEGDPRPTLARLVLDLPTARREWHSAQESKDVPRPSGVHSTVLELPFASTAVRYELQSSVTEDLQFSNRALRLKTEVLVFCNSVKEAKVLADLLNDLGVPAGHYNGNTRMPRPHSMILGGFSRYVLSLRPGFFLAALTLYPLARSVFAGD